MNVNEYISSGILESYVLGAVSPQEKQEVECMSHIYPAIREELIRLQSVLEKSAEEGKKNPPASLKKNILAQIKKIPQGEKEETKIIPAEKTKSLVIPWIITAAAASVAIILFFFLRSEQNAHETEIASMKNEAEKWKEDYLTLDATAIALNDLNVHMGKELDMFRNPDFKTVFLASSETDSEKGKIIICWNKNDGSVMIAVESIPDKPDEMDYQLWAIVDGKPMDMGVLAEESNGNFSVLETKVENPQAFAITLEKKGGSPVPTLENLFLAGNL